MRNHRFVMLSFAVAAVFSVLAYPSQAEDPIVKLVNSQSGKCLQPINGSSAQGVAIVQQTCNGSAAQQWTVSNVNSTRVHLMNRSSHMCLDARGGATNGTPIQQWTCNKISNENWSFGITNNLLSSAVSNTFSHCIATPGTQDGLAMELRACDTKSPAQIWSRPPG
jgi:Ricin-type beta-trefoil lectin domain